jgi:glycosyltransferase involved in cell wall biosynthesis
MCSRKHLLRVDVLVGEIPEHPEHYLDVLGNLDLAAEHIIQTHPKLAALIRTHRKRLELDRGYAVPTRMLVLQVDNLIQQEEQAGRDPEGCKGCGKRRLNAPQPVPHAHRGAWPDAPQKEVPEDPPEPLPEPLPVHAKESVQLAGSEGSLILLTALGGFESSYSLSSVILDQCRAGIKAGFSVHLVLMRDADKRLLPEIQGLFVDSIIPNLGWLDDESQAEKAGKIQKALEEYLSLFSEGMIITHDLLFQAAYINAAEAIHRIARIEEGRKVPKFRWFHQIHSNLGPRPHEAVAQYRARLPKGHKLLLGNSAEIPKACAYFGISQDDVHVMRNPVDPVPLFGMSERVRTISSVARMGSSGVVQTYPLSMPRAESKGLKRVIEVFAKLKGSVPVSLVIANAHANSAGTPAMIAAYKEYADSLGLMPDLCFVSEIFPHLAGPGLDRTDIGHLFLLSNVFCFPSVSESCGLVMLEAALAGNLLVLNRNLASASSYFPEESALWAKWPALGDPPMPDEVWSSMAETLVQPILKGLKSQNHRKTVLLLSSIEEAASTLRHLNSIGIIEQEAQ